MHDNVLRLPTIEVRRHFAMLLLTLVSAAGSLTLSRGRTATTANALVVGGGIVGE